MALSIKKVNGKNKEVKSLLKKAFSKEEQIPFVILCFRALTKNISFLAFYDRDSFVGFSYCVESDHMAFILLLAVIEESRGKGYGSEILAYLRDKYQKKPITVNIEPLDVEAKNASERERRLAFYERNGYLQTGYMVKGEKVPYMVLSSDGKLDVNEYLKLLKKFYLNTYRPKVER